MLFTGAGEYAYVATPEAMKNAGLDPDYTPAEKDLLYNETVPAKAVIEANISSGCQERYDARWFRAVFPNHEPTTVTHEPGYHFKLGGIQFYHPVQPALAVLTL